MSVLFFEIHMLQKPGFDLGLENTGGQSRAIVKWNVTRVIAYSKGGAEEAEANPRWLIAAQLLR